eukprot:TCONS_00033089-protein
MFQNLFPRNGNGDNIPAAPQEPAEEHADEVQPINEQPPAPTDRFELDPEAAEEKWELPNNLLEYIHSADAIFIHKVINLWRDLRKGLKKRIFYLKRNGRRY